MTVTAQPETATAPAREPASPSAPPHISVVIPVYRASDCLQELYRRLVTTLSALTDRFEILLVEDCGPDDSWEKIQALAAADPRVRGLGLSRNFGQHSAITAGLHHARGSWVVVMDCDLQDQPEEIAKLYAKAQQGYEVVLGRRTERKDSASKRLSSMIFWGTFNYLTDLDYDGTVANFSVVSRKVVDQLLQMNEQVRFYGGFLTWMGFRRAYVDVEHAPRFAGSSSYTLIKLFRMAIPIILAYSNKPLRLCVASGLGIAALSVVAGVYYVVKALLFGVPVLGWASLIVTIFFSTGTIIAVLGVLGLYIDRIFTEVKRRPIFIVAHRTDGEET